MYIVYDNTLYDLEDEENHYELITRHKAKTDKNFVGLKKCEKRKVALMCLERQFKAYQQLAKNRQWDKKEEYREIFDICWDAILNNKELSEEVWEKHERIKPENVNNETKEYAEIKFAYGNIFANNMGAFLEMLLDDTGGEESFCLFNIEFILSYLNENKGTQDENVTSEYIKKEVENQSNDIVYQKNLKSLIDVQNWYEQDECLRML